MSLVAHYKLNDDLSNTTVVNEKASDGTLIGGNNTEDLSESGKINNCLHFDGSADYVDIGLNTFSASAGAISVWAKNDSSSPAGYQYIVCLLYTSDAADE